MNRRTELKPTAVPFPAKQVGETEPRWGWVEPCVWTDRMLTTLEHGVKGGKWFSLIDKTYREQNLFAAFRKVAANDGAAGVDHVSIERFDERLTPNLRKLSEQLQGGTYRRARKIYAACFNVTIGRCSRPSTKSILSVNSARG